MRTNILFLLFAVVIAQSDNAIITIYKDGTVLVKQPINQTLKKGVNEVYWDKIPTTIHYDTPFLNISNVILCKTVENIPYSINISLNGIFPFIISNAFENINPQWYPSSVYCPCHIPPINEIIGKITKL